MNLIYKAVIIYIFVVYVVPTLLLLFSIILNIMHTLFEEIYDFISYLFNKK